MSNIDDFDLSSLASGDLKSAVRALQKKFESESRAPELLEENEVKEVQKLAAVGLAPENIALAMGWGYAKRRAFVILADVPASDVAVAIAQGRAAGLASPQIKLQEAAAGGNIEAAKAIREILEGNRFANLMASMDDDEF